MVFSVAGDHCRDKTTVDEMGDPKSDDWLPEGWRVEVKVRNSGKKDKFYFPPTGGFRFNSKIEVSRYLNGSHPKSEEKVVIEKTVPEGLPLGWTKEIKVTKKGGRIRRDPVWNLYFLLWQNFFMSSLVPNMNIIPYPQFSQILFPEILVCHVNFNLHATHALKLMSC